MKTVISTILILFVVLIIGVLQQGIAFYFWSVVVDILSYAWARLFPLILIGFVIFIIYTLYAIIFGTYKLDGSLRKQDNKEK